MEDQEKNRKKRLKEAQAKRDSEKAERARKL